MTSSVGVYGRKMEKEQAGGRRSGRRKLARKETPTDDDDDNDNDLDGSVNRRGKRGQTTSEISYLVQRFIVGETVNEGPLIDDHFRARRRDREIAFGLFRLRVVFAHVYVRASQTRPGWKKEPSGFIFRVVGGKRICFRVKFARIARQLAPLTQHLELIFETQLS